MRPGALAVKLLVLKPACLWNGFRLFRVKTFFRYEFSLSRINKPKRGKAHGIIQHAIQTLSWLMTHSRRVACITVCIFLRLPHCPACGSRPTRSLDSHFCMQLVGNAYKTWLCSLCAWWVIHPPSTPHAQLRPVAIEALHDAPKMRHNEPKNTLCG